MFRAIQSGCVLAVLLAVPTLVHADWLANADTATVVFSDGFETGAVGSAPTATVGAWGNWHVDTANGAKAVVTDEATSGIAAYDGGKFLEVNRTTGNFCWFVGGGVNANSGATDTIQAEFAVRVDSGMAFVLPTNGLGTEFTELGFYADGTAKYYGSSWETLGQTLNVGAWNKVVMTRKNDTDSWSIRINDQTAETFGGWGVSGVWDGIELGAGGASVAYFDAAQSVPEPSACILLGNAAAAFVAYAWRRRR
jgi:hypothetical protein